MCYSNGMLERRRMRRPYGSDIIPRVEVQQTNPKTRILIADEDDPEPATVV
jgi:hypothetical protein